MRKKQPVPSITSVARPLSEDVHGRTVRYLIAMSVRTVCVIGVVFTDDWLRWVMVVGAVILPYIAVVMANAGRERPREADSLVERPQLPAGPSTSRPSMPPIDLKGGYLR